MIGGGIVEEKDSVAEDKEERIKLEDIDDLIFKNELIKFHSER